MRFRSIFMLLCPALFLTVPSASAQKRVFATVNPNAEVLNGNADIYNPATGKFMPAAGQLNVARGQHVAVTLIGGKVLIAGGYNNRYLTSAETFNPATGLFDKIKDDQGDDVGLSISRSGAAAVLLPGGRVLIAGGYNGSYLSSAEIYDPTTETFTTTSNYMNEARLHATATRMNNGKILLAGGFNSAYVLSAEIYNPADGSFTPTTGSMSNSREGHTATLLPDGTVLVVGGCNNEQSGNVLCDSYIDVAEIYHPDYDEDEEDDNDDEFTDSGTMVTPRSGHSATLLSNGKVLIIGGKGENGVLATAEIYDPETGLFTPAGSLNTARYGHTASILPDGKILIAGGINESYLSSAEIYDPATGAFTTVSSEMSAARYFHTAATLKDGTVLLVGGQNSDFLVFDINERSPLDNISPSIVFSSDSKIGFVPYAGSGTVVAFSAETGKVLAKIATGGRPTFITPLLDGKTLAIVSALDSKIFLVRTDTLSLSATYNFTGTFGFGSILVLSPDGKFGYISSTASGEVIKFDVSSGTEVGRLKGLQAPAQITLTKDGNTLMIVDASATEIVFADSSTMTEKYTMEPLSDYTWASFTIFNKVVLNADETVGIIASQDADASSSLSTLFLFDPSTGKIIDTDGDEGNDVDKGGITFVGFQPGFTTLLPTGTFWLILNQDSLSIIPTWSPESLSNVASVSTGPLGSANIVTSPDAKYAYYTSAAADRVFQIDIGSQGVVGSFLVGDNPNESEDQASTLAFTPDYKTMAVVLFASNGVDLLSDTTVLKQTRLISYANEFTGLSLVNLSANPANLTITAMNDGGSEYLAENIENPVSLQLAPNAQAYFDVSNLFLFDNGIENKGRMVIDSDQPAVAGFSMTGKIRSSFLSSYVSNMHGVPLYPDYGDQLHDFIIPEIPQEIGTSARLYFINPNYNTSSYDVTHYGTDGTELQTSENNYLGGSIRETKQVSDLVNSTRADQVLILGGFDTTAASQFTNTAELFSLSSKNFSTTLGSMETTRVGHTATILRNNKVLVAGGRDEYGEILRSSVLFDPVKNIFVPTNGTMSVEHYRHTATLLANGKVLIAGGQDSISIHSTAELYDPVDDEFSDVASPMLSPRDAHTATLLPNGKVLLAGGIDGFGISATAELYDSSSSVFSLAGNLNAARAFHTAVLLPNGKVLIAGGYNGSEYLNSAELFDPSTGLFTATSSMISARMGHTSTLLSNGTVLIVGGKNASGILATAEIYDPSSNYFYATDGVLTYARFGHTATLMADPQNHINDRVLIAGGAGIDVDDEDDDNDEEEEITRDQAELYDPNTQQFEGTTGAMTSGRQGHTAVALQKSDQGYLRVTSTRGLLFTEVYDNGGADTSINGINVDKYAGITRIYSPQFVLMPPVYETLINIINGNQESEATVTLTLHAPDGRVLASPLMRVLPKNAQLKGNLWDLFQNDPTLLNQAGWVEVASNVDHIVGTISFTDTNDDLDHKYLTSFELSGVPLKRFLLPFVCEDSVYQTGIALLNSGDQPANARLELWGPSGTLDAFATITLAPGARISEILSALFPGMQSYGSGNIRVQSDQPLHSFGILYEKNLRFLSSVPPVPYPEK